jgi:hypothetical protein
LDGTFRRQSSYARDAPVEILAIEEFHGEEGLTMRRRREVKNLDDVGMAKAARDHGLATETTQRLGVGDQLVGDYLDGDSIVQANVQGIVDGAHASLPKQSDDLVGILEYRPE